MAGSRWRGCAVAPLCPLFWDQRYRRLHAFWRIVLFLLARSTLHAGLVSLAMYTGMLQAAPVTASVVASALATLLPAYLCARLLDRRRRHDLGLPLSRANWIELGLGLAVGGAVMTGIFILGLACGWLRITGWWSGDIGPASVLWPLGIWVLVGVHEEVWARGYLLVNLAEGLHGRLSARWALLAAWALTSIYFGLLHADNPSATWYSTLALMASGLFLGLGMILTGRLGLPIGLHIAWNLFEGTVYGFTVSGYRLSSFSVFSIVSAGPALWTGGAFGPEAGLLGALATLLGSGAILLIVRARRLALATALATPPAWREAPLGN